MRKATILGLSLWLAATGTAQERAPARLADLPFPRLCLLLPEARRPAREALRVADRVVAESGAALAVAVVFAASDGAARLGRRSPAAALSVPDPDGLLRAALAPDEAAEDAVGVWWDGDGRIALVEPFDDGARHVAADLRLRGHVGPHWREWGQAVRGADDGAALRAVVDAASVDLGARAEFLARVLALAVAREPELALDAALRGRVDRALTAAPRCEATQRAAFMVRLASGDLAAARSAAFGWVESARGRPAAARALIAALQVAGPSFDEVRALAFDVAVESAPHDALLLRAQFEHRFLVMHDRIGADRSGRALVDALGDDAQSLNSFAWRILTREPFAGQLDPLGLYAARAMLRDPGWRTFWRVDTLAFACFRNGIVDDAVRLQREAVDGADPSSRDRYEARLAEYVAALAPRPAPPAR